MKKSLLTLFVFCSLILTGSTSVFARCGFTVTANNNCTLPNESFKIEVYTKTLPSSPYIQKAWDVVIPSHNVDMDVTTDTCGFKFAKVKVIKKNSNAPQFDDLRG